MNLSDISTVKSILAKNGFTFKKSLGQNFLINPTVCPQMAEHSADLDTGVLEIGPGIGVLTSLLAQIAKKVVAIELDERLRPVLSQTLAEFDNTKVIFGDAMKLDLKQIIADEFADCDHVVVCANLPYYITSPIIMMLLESKLPIKSITVMVQKEAAERLCAKPGDKECGAISVAVSYYSDPELLFLVDRDSFLPAPNVDSAVIKLNVLPEPKVKVDDEQKFFKFIKACFAQRRKTLTNTVSSTLGIPKDKIISALEQCSLPPTVRAEQLPIETLAQLSDLLM
ncbi:MAG: 16S rRNA (adenine(1518)-N(6)/adenine(1519)-N(6))-dimethyltransferase RsmA [Clostridia bacterium]|nr:16S rRNA (adenine(1518)-N(6)/adenine(1519)-N(6))-dimethyltransferase RsmA [Clostridia bacterium]